MKRRLAREIALQTLFQMEFSDIDRDFAISGVCRERELKEDINIEYVCALVNGVWANKEAIDEQIINNTNNWKMERMSAIDRNILRIAVYEMLHAPDKLTPNIIINEAIEVSKMYGTDNSPKFINGILGNMTNAKS